MSQREFRYKKWFVKYTPEDGARIDKLNFDGVDLITTKPTGFRPPEKDYGKYETRPVYGYDDCFPSVSECPYPGHDWMVPDHGEVCWLSSWNVIEKEDRLLFSVESEALPLLLKRELCFNGGVLQWFFEVHNQGKETLSFQHVVHPLMPLKDIVGLQLPGFLNVFDDINQKVLDLKTPEGLHKYLLQQPEGTANMLFLHAVHEGKLSLYFKSGIILEIHFPHDLFPSLGIWWNNSGYPDENGIRRNECAFEPVPGSNSSLEDAYKEGLCFSLLPGEKMSWKIDWKMTKPKNRNREKNKSDQY